jgi:hypothetical protein
MIVSINPTMVEALRYSLTGQSFWSLWAGYLRKRVRENFL